MLSLRYELFWYFGAMFSLNYLTHYRPAMPFGNRKKYILADIFSSALSQFKIYHHSKNLKFNNLGISKA